MISPSTQNALNAQINLEQYTSQLYLAMSAHLAPKSFKGFSHWLRVQSAEEASHALKLVDFVLDLVEHFLLRSHLPHERGDGGGRAAEAPP